VIKYFIGPDFYREQQQRRGMILFYTPWFYILIFLFLMHNIFIMRILTLPVDDAVASSYENSPTEEKTKINSVINTLLTKVFKKKQNDELFNLMDKMSGEAIANGLTVEKLGELMEWDEETMKNLFGEDYTPPTDAR
jgi:hypothetical protein